MLPSELWLHRLEITGPVMFCWPAISSTRKPRPMRFGDRRWVRWRRRRLNGGYYRETTTALRLKSLWDSVRRHAPANVHLLDTSTPVEIAPEVVLLPAPAPRRFPGRDLTEWMPSCITPECCLRIGLAHGGVLSFGSEEDGAEIIPPDRAQSARLDYLALGDWHGMKQFGDRTFYSGTPERDRFKHSGRGSCLAVALDGPGAVPQVTSVQIGQFDWQDARLELTPGRDTVAAIRMILPAEGVARRDTVVRICATGWVRLTERMALMRAVETAKPDFWHFEFSDANLSCEYSPNDLDEIAKNGALRLAADDLWREAQSAKADPRAQAIAAAALTRLFNYAQGAAR